MLTVSLCGCFVMCTPNANAHSSSRVRSCFRLYGDYESLKSCCAVDMLVDLTGGVAQKYNVSELDIKWDINRVRLFQELQEAVDSKALLTCSIEVSHWTMVFGVLPAFIKKIVVHVIQLSIQL